MKSSLSPVNRGSLIYGCTFAVCFLIFIYRGWVRLTYNNLWAEDASVFFQQALIYDFATLKMPFAGFYHTIDRLITLGIIHLVPTTYWAFAVTLISCAIVAAITAAISRLGHEWLIPSTAARIGLAICLCFAPGFAEMLGNLANMHWPLFFWFALLGLRDPKQRISPLEFVAATLISLSIGIAVLLIPLFIWRVINAVKSPELRNRRTQEYYLLGLCLVTTTWLLFLNRNGVEGYPRNYTLEFAKECLILLYEHMQRLLILTPWLGLEQQNYLWRISQPMWLNWIVPALVTVALGWYFIKNRKTVYCPLLLFTGGIAMWPVLNLIARSSDSANFIYASTNYSLRYSYPLSFVAAIFWLAVIRPTRMFGDRRAELGTVFVVFNFIGHAVYNPQVEEHQRMPGYELRSYWEVFSPQLDSAIHTGYPCRVVVPADPLGWELRYVVSDQRRNCPSINAMK